MSSSLEERHFFDGLLFFSVAKVFFERKVFNSVIGVSFRPETAHDEQSSRVADVLHNKRVGCRRSSETGGGGLESRYRPYISRLFRY